MEFSEVIQKRYSCKNYKNTQITGDQLQAILEAGRMAPTAKNGQEQRIYVIQSEEGLRFVDQVSPCRYGAPTVLAVAYDKNNMYTYPDGSHVSGAEDAAIVATHMLLAATNAGVDSCWINCFDPDKLAFLLQLPENEEILMLMDLGYASDKGEPLPNHFTRKPLDETVTYC